MQHKLLTLKHIVKESFTICVMILLTATASARPLSTGPTLVQNPPDAVTTHFYVSTTGSSDADGTSWATAVNDPYIAINMAYNIHYNYGVSTTVWVAAGTYYGDTLSGNNYAIQIKEGVNVYGGFAGNEAPDYNLSLRNLEANATVIDGQGARRCLYQGSAFNTTTVIDGITLRNGYGDTNISMYGGAAYLRTGLTVSNCRFENNIAYNGGAFYAYGSGMLKFTDCRFTGNYARFGGAASTNNCVYMERCVIDSNNAMYSGGGIYVWGGFFSNCLFQGNHCTTGGGVYSDGRTDYGYTGGTFLNCNFVGNSATSSGGGMYGNSSNGTLINSIVWGNTNGNSRNAFSGSMTFLCCGVEGSAPGRGCLALTSDNTATTGYAPNFAAPGTDWHLTQGSPLIGMGYDTTLAGIGNSVDLVGSARVQQGRIDIGCYESPYTAVITLPSYPDNIIYVKASAADGGNGTSWANAFNRLDEALEMAALSSNVSKVYVAEGTYYGDTLLDHAFTLTNGVNLYGGFAGNEPASYNLNLRQPSQHPTVLDGRNMQCLIYQPMFFSIPTVVDGFTITSGNSTNGGGAYLQGGLTLQNCTVTGCNASSNGGGIYINQATVANCTFSNNNANYGGAILSYLGTVHHTVLHNNTAQFSGGALYFNGGTCYDNLVANNNANYGGGVYAYNGANIYETDIVSNMATYGGGVYCNNAQLFNTVIWGNRAPDNSDSGTPNLYLYSGSITSCAIENVSTGGGNNILLSSDNSGMMLSPKFVAPSAGAGADYAMGDYHLTSSSILAGRADIDQQYSSTDFDGNPRVRQGGMDLGCYESEYNRYTATVPQRLYVKADATGSGNGQSWSDALTSLNTAIIHANAYRIIGDRDSLDIWVAAGTYYGDTLSSAAIMPADGINLIGGFAGNEPASFDPAQRDIAANTTVISGRGQRRALYQAWLFDIPTVVDGFTIRDGYGSNSGSGIYLKGNITLRNCTVTGHRSSSLSSAIMTESYTIFDRCNFTGNGDSITTSPVFSIYNSTLEHCKVTDNRSAGNMMVMYGNTTINTSLIANNAATYNAGITSYNYLYINNTDIVGNTSTSAGYNVLNYNSSPLHLRNSVIWGNRSADSLSTVVPSSSTTIAGCAIEGLDGFGINLASENNGIAGGENYPMFVNPAGGDYHFSSGSALLDANDTSLLTKIGLPLGTDLDGVERPQFGLLDIGCYESDVLDNCPRITNLTVSDINENSAFITWDAVGISTTPIYNIQISTDGSNWSGPDTTSAKHLFLTSLDGQTDYYVRVQASCGNDSGQPAVKPFRTRSFSNNCDPVVTVAGESNGTTNSIPVNIWYCYSYTQQIFTPHDIPGGPRQIDTISFQYYYSSPYNRNITVYLAHVQDSVASGSFFPSTGFVEVYSGQFNFNNSGAGYWCPIVLETPFDYNGEDNLLVAVIDNTGSYYNSNNKFYTHTTPYASAMHRYTDNGAYSVDAPPSSPNTLNYRNNIRFGGTCLLVDTNSCPRPNIAIDDVTMNSVHVYLAAGATCQLQLRNITTDGEWQEITGIAGEGTIGQLAQGNEYMLRLRNICGSDTSYWTTKSFATMVSDSPIVYVKPQATGTGDGSSWDNATASIATAQQIASRRAIDHGSPAVVWVAAGTYYGDTTSTAAFTMTPGISVYGGFAGNEPESYDLGLRNLAANVSILHGNNQRQVLRQTANFSESTAVVWDGFTITGGYTSDYYGAAAAYLYGYSALVNCLITGNTNTNSGSIVRTEGSYTLTSDSTMGSHRRYNTYLSRCTIVHNSTYNGYGPAVMLSGAAMDNSLVANNTAVGINNNNYSIVYGVTVVRNSGYTEIVGISGSSRVENSVVWGNTRTGGGNTLQASTDLNILYSAVEGGSGENGCIGLSSENNGTMLNPMFASPSTGSGADFEVGNYTLLQGSPLVGRGGSPSYTVYTPAGESPLPAVDLAANTRVQQGAVDIGCYESPYAATPLPQYTDSIVYVTQNGAGTMDGTSWANATPNLDQAIALAYGLGVRYVWVAAGTYTGDTTQESAFHAKTGVNVYGGFAGNEPPSYDLGQRDLAANVTVLDGQNLQRVVEHHNTSLDVTTIWDGFTVTRGLAPNTNANGAGLFLQRGFVLSNCILTGNGAGNDNVTVNGAAVYVTNATASYPAVIRNCDIHGNGNAWSYGSAVYANSYTHIVGCRLRNNTAYNATVHASSGYTYIYNTLIDHNTSQYNGSAVYAYNYVYLINSTVANNNTVSTSSSSGGIYSGYSNGLHLHNSILWGNTVGSTSPTRRNLIGSYSVEYMSHSAIEGFDGNYSDRVMLLAADNFSATGQNDGQYYPSFVNPDRGDYRLHSSSPLINRGLSDVTIAVASGAAGWPQATDLRGMDRTFGDTADIGAYEWNGEQFCLTPSGLAVSNITENSAYVTWNHLGDNHPFYCTVVVTTEDGDTVLTESSTQTSTFITGLTPSTKYTVSLNSTCSDGSHGEPSNQVRFKTESGCYEYTSLGEPYSTSGSYPFYNSYNNSYSQQIVTAGELNFTAQEINRIDYHLQAGAYISRHLQIYLGHTGRDHFEYGDRVFYPDSMQLVFDGTVEWNNTSDDYDWVAVDFDTTFSYNGTTNLMITVVSNDYGNSSQYYSVSYENNYRTCYNYRSSPTYLIDDTTLTVSNRSRYRNLMRLSHTCQPSGCGSVNIVTSSYDSTSATLLYSASPSQQVEAEYCLAADSLWMPITGLSGGQIHITGLQYNTGYIARIRQVCPGQDASEWRYADFTTLPSMSPIIYVAQNNVGRADGSSWSNAMNDINRALRYADARGTAYGTPAEVWVAAGTYYGDTTFTSAFTIMPGIKVYGGLAGNEPATYDLSQRPVAHGQWTLVSQLDGRNARRVLNQESNFTSATAALWDGFTITGGNSGYNSGGGVMLRAWTTLRNCRIRENQASYSGGGIYASGSSYTEYDSLYNPVNRYTPCIENCEITNNRTTSSYSGGGIYAGYADIIGCLVANNQSGNYGGGIYVNYGCHIEGSTIVANKADGYGGIGGSSFHLAASVVWGNISTGNSYIDQVSTSSSMDWSAVEGPVSNTNCIVLSASNTGSAFSPMFTMPTQGAGYDYADGDWTLQQGSPLINRGGSSLTSINWQQATDLGGNPRIQQDTMDMGCYESPYGSTPVPVYADSIVYVAQGGAGTMDGTSWANAMPDLQNALDIASTNHYTVWVAAGTYYGGTDKVNAFVARDGVNLYGGFVGNETSLSQRPMPDDNRPQTTILDGDHRQRVLFTTTDFDNPTVWDGVVIQNGSIASHGAGAWLRGNFTLRNSTVRNNTSTGSNNGGGIYTYPGYSYNRNTIINCLVEGNASYYGGGIYSRYSHVIACRITDNTAHYGAGIHTGYYSTVAGSVIDHNTATYNAAVYHSGGQLAVTNCDIVNNTNTGSSYTGGFSSSSSSATLNNTIVWGNKRGYFPGNIYGNTTLNHCAVEDWVDDATVNLAAENDGTNPAYIYPRFIDPLNGDYRLHSTSPLIDIGDSTMLVTDYWTISTDLDGNPRVFGDNVDLGAYESSEVSTCPSVTGLKAENVTTSTALLSWLPATGTSYAVQYAISDGNNNPYQTVTTADTAITLTGLAFNRTYVARVRSLCSDNSTSLFSIPVTFTTYCDPSDLDTLSDFTTFTPAAATVVYSDHQSFSWAAIPEATSYDFYLWRTVDAEPTTPTVSGLTLPTVQNIQLPGYNFGVDYSWKVVAWNECLSKTSPTVSLSVTQLPDLHVSAVSNSAPVAGQSMTVSWTVTNDGQGATPPGTSWSDRIWLSVVDGVGGGFWYNVEETLLAEVTNLMPLDPGESYTNTVTVDIPQDYIGGYYLFVMTDQGNAVNIDYSPTGGTSAPAVYTPSATGSPYPYLKSQTTSYPGNFIHSQVRESTTSVDRGPEDADNFFYKVLTILPPPTPDLVVEHISHPTSTFSGNSIEVQWRVRNQGDASATGWWRDAVYIQPAGSAELNLSSATFLAYSQRDNSSIAPDSTYTTALFVQIPVEMMGDYTIFVVTDYDNHLYESIYDGNNTSASASVLNVTLTPPPDLVPTWVSVPDTLSPGGTYRFHFTVANQGSSETPVSYWVDGLYVSQLSTFNAGASLLLGERSHRGYLTQDSSYSSFFDVTLPDNISGEWYLYVVTDRNNDVFEYTFDDNNAYSAPAPINILRPNLTVSAIGVADTINSADSVFTLTWTVLNSGPGAVAERNFRDIVRIGGTTVYTASQQKVNIPVGGSTVRTATIAVPCGQDAITITVTTDADNTVAEADETDNIATRQGIGILSPDLGVGGLTITAAQQGDSSAAIRSGKPVLASWTVSNHGSAPIANRLVTDRLYLSTSSTSYTASNLVATWRHAVTLATGDSTGAEYLFNMPNGISGEYYLHIVTNADGDVCEGSNQTANTAHSGSMAVELSPWIDLVPSSVAVPTEANYGELVAIQYMLRNNGTAALQEEGFKTRFYWSHSLMSYSSQNVLATQDVQTDLAVGDSTWLTASFQVPTSLNSGNYYIHCVVDADNAIYEHTGEGNNTAVSPMMHINEYLLDLAATSLNGPATVQWGQTANYVLTVGNNSTVPTLLRSWVDELYLSDDSELQTTDRKIGSLNRSDTVAGGASYTDTFSVTVPMGTQPTVWLIAVADAKSNQPDINLTNNVVRIPLTVNSVPTPDLTVTSFEVISESIRSGQPTQALYTVSNTSTTPVDSATWSDKVFLGDGTDAIEIGTLTHRGFYLAAGASYTDTITFTVPLPLEGTFTFVLKANVSSGFFEADATNNSRSLQGTVVLPDPGDLVVRNVLTADTVTSGSIAPITWDVVNIGTNSIEGQGLRSLVYLSTDSVFDAGDKMLGNTETASVLLPPGQSVQQQLNTRISGVPEGNYYLIVKTDVKRAFNETDKNNNTGRSVLPIHIVIRNLAFNTTTADTLHNDVASDFKLNVGQNTSETVRLHLHSGDSLQGAVNMIYISHNTIGDNLNYTYSTVGQYTANPELYIPSTLPGYYGVNVYGSTPVADSQLVTLRADIIPFELRSVSPTTGGIGGKVTLELTGSRFRPDMKVWLAKEGDTIVADTLYYVNYYKSYARFDLADHDTGLYSATVVNFCEGEATLNNAFRVTVGNPEALAYNLVFPNSPRPNRNIVMMLEFGNLGTSDITGAVLTITSVGGAYIATTPDGISAQQTELQVPLTIEGEPDGVLRPGVYGTIPIYGYTSGPLVFTIERIH